MSAADQGSDPPVTIDVIQKIKPGCEAEFEQVLADLTEAAKAFEGHLGANIFRPSDHANPEYRIVFKFDILSHLRQWEESAMRRKLLARARRLTVGDSKWQTLTGLETWFTLSTQQAIVPPPRYKMLIVTCIAAFPTVNIINALLQPLKPLPPLFRTFIATVVLLTLMTYVIMPRMTKLFAGWLYPNFNKR
jgi:antibiotic biosynthesis monooxygenase (ABM) superfamily enzyme